MIVKFDNHNTAGYRTALDKLRQFEKDAPKVVASCFGKSLNIIDVTIVRFSWSLVHYRLIRTPSSTGGSLALAVGHGAF
jgi:hypothetical protein